MSNEVTINISLTLPQHLFNRLQSLQRSISLGATFEETIAYAIAKASPKNKKQQGEGRARDEAIKSLARALWRKTFDAMPLTKGKHHRPLFVYVKQLLEAQPSDAVYITVLYPWAPSADCATYWRVDTTSVNIAKTCAIFAAGLKCGLLTKADNPMPQIAPSLTWAEVPPEEAKAMPGALIPLFVEGYSKHGASGD